VLVIGATNRPEELDEAARRRMPKQLYVPLPCGAARAAMLDRALQPRADAGGGGGGGGGAGVTHALSPADVGVVVARTAGYSGSDMRALIQEACQGPVRDALRRPATTAGEGGGSGGGGAPGARPPPPALAGLTPADLRPVTLRDFAAAARVQRPSVAPEEVARYEAYDAKHGAKYVEGGVEDVEMEW
jgi:SpoVK/Ycf46/Vps4 family AAA+-type ATPase